MKDNSNTSGYPQRKQMTCISLALVFILLIFVSSMLIFSNIVDDVKMMRQEALTHESETKFDQIIKSKMELEKLISGNLKNVALSIESDIKSELGLKVLEAQLNQGSIPNDLEAIFRDNIYDVYLTGVQNDKNDIFICNYNGVISDFSKTEASENDINRDWDYVISSQYNNPLATSTIDKILKQETTEMLVFEKSKSKDPNHIYVENMDIDELKRVYMEEGLEGLRGYTFLLPVYITKDGDIFGKDDITAGHITYNNKFIVIQEYDLYDYIINRSNCDIDDTSFGEYTDKQYNDILTYLYIFAISLIIGIICSILFISVLSNRLFDAANRNNHQNTLTVSPFGRRQYDIDLSGLVETANKEKAEQLKPD